MSATAKEKLLAHLDLQDEVGAFSDEAFDELGRLVEAIRLENVYPAPLDTLDKVVGRWDTDFAHFGGKHSAGKPNVHDSDLKWQSFNRFPAAPIRVTRICQEISQVAHARVYACHVIVCVHNVLCVWLASRAVVTMCMCAYVYVYSHMCEDVCTHHVSC